MQKIYNYQLWFQSISQKAIVVLIVVTIKTKEELFSQVSLNDTTVHTCIYKKVWNCCERPAGEPAAAPSRKAPRHKTPRPPTERSALENGLSSFHLKFPPTREQQRVRKRVYVSAEWWGTQSKIFVLDNVASESLNLFHQQSGALQVLDKLLPPLSHLCLPALRPAALHLNVGLLLLFLVLLPPAPSSFPPRANFPHQHKVYNAGDACRDRVQKNPKKSSRFVITMLPTDLGPAVPEVVSVWWSPLVDSFVALDVNLIAVVHVSVGCWELKASVTKWFASGLETATQENRRPTKLFSNLFLVQRLFHFILLVITFGVITQHL